ncbi:hypothetical protein GCM10010363_60900 [Streptomyces omiyaensis]|uniref:hypothetical protein n=1 Tax=Streptomyces omiyaensis TaxID=68247 RepID=UPI001675CAF7|nr:hypothetical protein [Streptomyces omiyaensis]GGY71403.1 hypothetical protein GCM10010363_60900 [Streptomyces omiyaensis]
MTEHDSVLAGMGEATWSAEDGTAYEVALEGTHHVVGAYSRLIAEAEEAGDTERARILGEEQGAWAARRADLSPADRATVDAVTAECTQELARLRDLR